MEQPIKEAGQKIKEAELVESSGKMEQFLKGITIITKKMEWESLSGQMVIFIQDSLKIIENLEKGL